MTNGVLSDLLPYLEIAEKEGADEVELFAHSIREKSVMIESNVLKTAISGYQQGVGIRVLVNKSLGFTAVNSFDKERVVTGIRNAISIAKVTPSQDHYSLPAMKKVGPIGHIYDEAVDSIQMEGIIDNAKDMLDAIHETDSRLTVDSAGVEARSEIRAIASSSGMEFEEKKSSMTWGVWGWAVDGDDIGTFQAESDSVVSIKDLNHLDGVALFSEKALKSLRAKKTKAFKGCAIFSPEAVQDLIAIVVMAALGITIQGGNSYLQDKIGEEIADKSLTLSDDGTIPNSVSSKSFDREGVPHTPLSIIDSGVFKGVLHNAFTANKAGLDSTGHAFGTYRQAPSTAATNIEIGGGSKSFDEMVSEIDHGIYVQRISAMPDPASGDFSAVVKGGKLIEQGELTHTLKEITSTGNIFEGIKNISAISKERKHIRTPGRTQFSYRVSSWLVPYLRIENLDFAS